MATKTGLLCFLILVIFLSSQKSSADAKLEEQYGTKPLDGVIVEALESYRNPKTNQVSFDLGIWPFNAYYNGFSVNAGYTYFVNKTLAWEVLDGSYLYTVDKNLTSQLAQNYGVNPVQIERLNYVISSNAIYFHSYGKFILAKEYIRYFRSGAMGGVGLVSSNKNTNVAASIGWRFEVYTNDNFSWKLDIRDFISLSSDLTNNLAFNLGTAYSF